MDPKIRVVYEACFGKREYGPCLAKPLPMPARAKVKWGTWKMETILPRVNRYICIYLYIYIHLDDEELKHNAIVKILL